MAKLRPSQPKLSVETLQQFPRTRDGDQELLNCLHAAGSLSSTIVAFLKGELPHRPSIYVELTRFLWKAEAR